MHLKMAHVLLAALWLFGLSLVNSARADVYVRQFTPQGEVQNANRATAVYSGYGQDGGDRCAGVAPVWLAVMDYLHRSGDGLKLRSDAPAVPKGVEVRNIQFDPAMELRRRELFLEGTAHDVIVANQETLNSSRFDSA